MTISALRLLAHLDRSLGEVMMKEGMQYQQAGATENAKERYTRGAGIALRGGAEPRLHAEAAGDDVVERGGIRKGGAALARGSGESARGDDVL
jgi:hypothetical protein